MAKLPRDVSVAAYLSIPAASVRSDESPPTGHPSDPFIRLPGAGSPVVSALGFAG
jgi:hypothetical protein